MAKVFIQMGVFTNNKEPSAAVMFPIELRNNLMEHSQLISAKAMQMLADYYAKSAEGSLPEVVHDPEKMALAILDIYHKVSAQPVLLESVMIKRDEKTDSITITLRRE